MPSVAKDIVYTYMKYGGLSLPTQVGESKNTAPLQLMEKQES